MVVWIHDTESPWKESIPLSGTDDPSSRCFAEAGDARDKVSLAERVAPYKLNRKLRRKLGRGYILPSVFWATATHYFCGEFDEADDEARDKVSLTGRFAPIDLIVNLVANFVDSTFHQAYFKPEKSHSYRGECDPAQRD